jgi:hypothetical protein
MEEGNNKTKICKFYLKRDCNHGDKCKFIHDKEACRNYFFEGICNRNENCKFKHIYTEKNVFSFVDTRENSSLSNNKLIVNQKHQKHNKHNKPKNTENFVPSHKPSDMNILVNQSKESYSENDVVIVTNFINETTQNEIYDNLLKEMKETNIDNDKLWKEWHGDSHLIADDNQNWKDKVPTFNMILNEIEKYFNMKIRSTRFNLYKDSNDWKPFHHDAAAIKEHIAKNQNFTVGVSFGATRAVAFEHVKSKTVISIPLVNCTAYAFAKNINVEWKHGIPQIHPDKAFNDGRISIIAWGKINEFN